MRFPNKLNFYRQSVIYCMPIVLRRLNKPVRPIDLYKIIKNEIKIDVIVYQEALVCLYAMRVIDMNGKGELVRC